ncbi:CDP-diacylglycerol diphosphatase [Paraburkholderia saeva]|uniref:CDP-diacylglycerol pyrophosphatase n=1 Tax=Paraburkholderia saeva TaxID=2777537 RepID=A0A9N8RVV6_9BURK|nr:CDP-diacylglycerol diphosphatase [Paraburkholderia saeva]CAG4888373.1 CDP-diacylglycerol pyrophosphatase [Paraburkholderia saeva]CAG4895616.1 CDP-diacylglycerol pyrophosphatase [Paraburkholderia saeva]CAG4897096.1 CDP-diacylglycerol pyrophosphatase [Paraburkholderia saeva]
MRLALYTFFSVVLAATGSGCATLAAADPNALWHIVDGQCVMSMQSSGTPGFCTRVDLKAHYAILKDINGASQYLLIPTERVMGIESPQILADDAPPYWSEAWGARTYVQKAVRQDLGDEQLGLEINSPYRRSQSQLHIHIDCMRNDVIEKLARHRGNTPGKWHWDTIDGNRYRVMRVTSIEGADDPFRVVARELPKGTTMASQTILVTGAGASAASDGWLIVNSSLDLDDGSGSAEPLMDHACKVARKS